MKKVSVIGLGKLGACMAATIASKGSDVVGVDVNPRNVEQINQGLPPVAEPGLADLIRTHKTRLSATTNCRKAVLETDITFLIVPTPSDENGDFTLRYVAEACREIGAGLREKSTYHLVVLTSTVLPGTIESGVIPILEEFSGKRAGVEFGFCYNPEFIALGSVIADLLNPDFVLIGESDARAGDLLEAWYATYCENMPRMARMNFVNAELTKISVNSFVTTKITFANVLARLCERLPGADVDVVSAALGLDSRIGRRYLTGALGYGGPCFPRDNQAVAHVARKAGVSAPLAEATDQTNRMILKELAKKVGDHLRPGMVAGILGLAYKPDTDVVEESAGVALALTLAEAGHRVVVFDPMAMETARRILNEKVEYAATWMECLTRSDLIVVANPDPAFKEIEARHFARAGHSAVVMDCWRILREKLSEASGLRYVPLGVGDVERKVVSDLETVTALPQPSHRH